MLSYRNGTNSSVGVRTFVELRNLIVIIIVEIKKEYSYFEKYKSDEMERSLCCPTPD